MTGKRRAPKGSKRPSPRSSRRGLWLVVGALVLAGAAAGGLLLGLRSPSRPPVLVARGQSTLLVQVAGSKGTSIGGVLIGSAPGDGVELLVPADVITAACGVGETDFGSLLPLPDGAQTAATAVSTALGGVRIDGTWTLTLDQLAGLVTAVHGVRIDVDVTVTQHTRHGDRVIVQSGRGVEVDGTQAAAYAAYRDGPKEPAAAQTARLQTVLEAVIDKLPGTPAAAQQLLTGLGTGAQSTLGAPRLAALLEALAADDRGSGVLADDLPTQTLDTGGARSYAVDTAAAQVIAHRYFQASLPAQSGPPLTVDIENGLGTPGLVLSACRRLAAAGISPMDGGNAESFSSGRSEILVQSRSVASAKQGDRVAAALRLPDGDVRVEPVGQLVADVIVVLGSDFKP